MKCGIVETRPSFYIMLGLKKDKKFNINLKVHTGKLPDPPVHPCVLLRDSVLGTDYCSVHTYGLHHTYTYILRWKAESIPGCYWLLRGTMKYGEAKHSK